MMIYCKISDGLGNQMFMYAFGYSLSKKYEKSLVLDYSILDCHPSRQYELNKFNLMYDKEISFKWAKLPIVVKGLRLLKDIYIRCTTKRLEDDKVVGYHPVDLGDAHNLYLAGYWQSEKYFSDYSKELREIFSPKINLSEAYYRYERQVGECDSVAIHIRRGDYTQNGWCIPAEYYLDAITKMSSLVQSPTYFIFSDDIMWSKELLKDVSYPTVFVEYDSPEKGLEDMLLISKCKNQIISNSTFSWWGAWLNSFSSKVVICPEYLMWRDEFYPESWIKIDCDNRMKG